MSTNQHFAQIRIDQYDYPLPDQRVAKHPLAERDQCLLLARDADGTLHDRRFVDLPTLLPTGCTLIYNNTRVINARLRFHKEAPEGQTGALIEIFCLEPAHPADYAQCFAQTASCTWMCLVGNSKKWKSGPLTMPLTIGGREVTLTAQREEKQGNASLIRFEWTGGVSFAEVIATAGQIPIPPYLNRDTEDSDAADYQTVYSHIPGSVAAPTAGLHFTDRVLADIDARGMRRLEVTLHVGAGTFQPVKSDTIADHHMHSEFIAVPRSVIEALATDTNPQIAVGTTTVRTLESLYHAGCLIHQGCWTGEVPQWYPYEADHPRLSVEQAMQAILDHMGQMPAFIGATRLIIAPGYQYRMVDGMVTNFHQPRSTLLLLVSAMVGDDWRQMYAHALQGQYRFLSYGDACYLYAPRHRNTHNH